MSCAALPELPSPSLPSCWASLPARRRRVCSGRSWRFHCRWRFGTLLTDISKLHLLVCWVVESSSVYHLQVLLSCCLAFVTVAACCAPGVCWIVHEGSDGCGSMFLTSSALGDVTSCGIHA